MKSGLPAHRSHGHQMKGNTRIIREPAFKRGQTIFLRLETKQAAVRKHLSILRSDLAAIRADIEDHDILLSVKQRNLVAPAPLIHRMKIVAIAVEIQTPSLGAVDRKRPYAIEH